ncbi:MAG: glycosyltransferase family 4 protein [Gordonia sp. (in: high G+C Gram-positive bacteria)]
MRVLVLIDAFRMGGAETLLAPMVIASRATDVHMDVVGLAEESVNAEKTMTILAAADIPTQSLGIKRLADPTAIPKLAGLIRRGGYDVVHAHLEMAMSHALPATRITRTPLVCTFHHVARELSGRAAWRERIAVSAASASERALFVSEASRASFQQMYRPRGLPANWQVMHNGIDISTFSPGPADPAIRAQLGGDDHLIVVLPAAFRDFKGIPVAIRAWPEVIRRHPNAVLTLVGGGDLEDDLRAEVDALGLQQSVRFAGVRTDMPDVYRAADLVLLPSTHGENLPTVLIEASASARTVAASRIGGIPDIVAEGETGLLFEPNNPAALAATVNQLLSDPDLRRDLGNAAELRAKEHFSSAAWISRLRDTYEEVIAQ